MAVLTVLVLAAKILLVNRTRGWGYLRSYRTAVSVYPRFSLPSPNNITPYKGRPVLRAKDVEKLVPMVVLGQGISNGYLQGCALGSHDLYILLRE